MFLRELQHVTDDLVNVTDYDARNHSMFLFLLPRLIHSPSPV